MARIFTGDYSTGDFSQWTNMQNKLVNGAPQSYPGGYSAQVISEDKDCGYIGRFELRDGDIPSFGGGERSEVGAVGPSDAVSGNTRFYAFSVKFDSAFPTNHGSLGWGVTNQWGDSTAGGSPTVSWGWQPDTPTGYWSLLHLPQSSPGVYLTPTRILDVALNLGNWHDVKVEIKFSTSDATGYVRAWLDGTAQTLSGGSTTFAGRTMIPGDTVSSYHEGYYRDAAMTTTAIIYHAGFRMADSAASL